MGAGWTRRERTRDESVFCPTAVRIRSTSSLRTSPVLPADSLRMRSTSSVQAFSMAARSSSRARAASRRRFPTSDSSVALASWRSVALSACAALLAGGGCAAMVHAHRLGHVPPALGVWQVINGDLRFTAVSLGIADLEGRVQIREGLKVGDQVVAYSENALNERSRIHVVDHISGVTQ